MVAAVVSTLHDAFRKSLDDGKVRELLDRFDQPVIHMNPAEYTSWATRMRDAEHATIERLGLKGSM
jgi:hypothetical protein